MSRDSMTDGARRGRVILIVVAVLLALALVAVMILLNRESLSQVLGGSPAPAATSTSPAPIGTSTPQPSTSAAPGDPDDPTQPSGDAQVEVTFVEVNADSGAIDASAFVRGVIESDGVCTLVATRRGSEATATSNGMPDAQTTQCGLLTIEPGYLVPGDWTVRVDYASPSSSGSSAETVVTVP